MGQVQAKAGECIVQIHRRLMFEAMAGLGYSVMALTGRGAVIKAKL